MNLRKDHKRIIVGRREESLVLAEVNEKMKAMCLIGINQPFLVVAMKL